MTQEHHTNSLSNLLRFMLIFDINRFFLHRETDDHISATVGWPLDNKIKGDDEDEIQEIEWDIQNFSNMEDVLSVVEYLRDNNLIDIDKFRIDEHKLSRVICDHFGWESERFNRALKSLLEFRVDMIDDGEKTDYFFLHF